MSINSILNLITIISRSTNKENLRSIRTNTHRINSTIKITNILNFTIFCHFSCTISKCHILSNKEIKFTHWSIISSFNILRIFSTIKKTMFKNIFSIAIYFISSSSTTIHSFFNDTSIFIFKSKEKRIVRILIITTIISTLCNIC